MMGFQEVIQILKNSLNILVIFFIPFFWAEWVLEFFQNLFTRNILCNIYFSHQDRLSRFWDNWNF